MISSWDLRGAYLVDAHLQGCRLKGVRLKRAHLGGATGLTKEQLKEAHINKETVLPYYLKGKKG